MLYWSSVFGTILSKPVAVADFTSVVMTFTKSVVTPALPDGSEFDATYASLLSLMYKFDVSDNKWGNSRGTAVLTA